MRRVIPVSFDEVWNGTKKPVDWTVQFYWGVNGCYFLDENETNDFNNMFTMIEKQSEYKPKKGDIIYASKASEIPRFKLKEFIKDNGLKKTSRNKYADVIIINRGYFNQLKKEIKTKEYTFCTKNHSQTVIKDIIKKRNTPIVTEIYNECNNYDLLAFLRTDKDRLSKMFKKYSAAKKEYEDSTHQVKGAVADFYRERRLIDLLEMFNENRQRILKGEVKFIFDEEFFIDLNKEGIELDDDYLETLRQMLFSSDEANVKLGFEMMANLVLDQPTLLSIAFLLNELVHTTRFRPSYYTSSNSNLKSLLKVFKTKGIHWDKDWKTFGTGLRLNFKDGKEGEIVKKFLLDNINREFKLNNSAAESLVDIVFATEVNELSLV